MDLISYLESKYPKLSLEEKYYLEINSLKVPPNCLYKDCNNHVSFISSKHGYKKGCCKTHSQKITMIERYGVDNAFKSEEIKEKIKQIFLFGIVAI